MVGKPLRSMSTGRLGRAAVLAALCAVLRFGPEPHAAEAPAASRIAAAEEAVTFPGQDVLLRAVLYRPAGRGPFPSVIALHGCAGLHDRSGALSPRHADWAARLT